MLKLIPLFLGVMSSLVMAAAPKNEQVLNFVINSKELVKSASAYPEFAKTQLKMVEIQQTPTERWTDYKLTFEFQPVEDGSTVICSFVATVRYLERCYGAGGELSPPAIAEFACGEL